MKYEKIALILKLTLIFAPMLYAFFLMAFYVRGKDGTFRKMGEGVWKEKFLSTGVGKSTLLKAWVQIAIIVFSLIVAAIGSEYGIRLMMAGIVVTILVRLFVVIMRFPMSKLKGLILVMSPCIFFAMFEVVQAQSILGSIIILSIYALFMIGLEYYGRLYRFIFVSDLNRTRN